MFEALSEQLILVVIVAVSSTVIGGLGGFFAVLRRCVTRIERRTFRHSTALMSIAEDMDKTTNALHNDANSSVAKTVERQLKDSEGNF